MILPTGMNWRASYVREAKTLATLGTPIMISQLSQIGMSVVDVTMAGNYGAAHLAGVGIGTGVFFPLMLLLTGTLMAVTPTVAQLRGAGRVEVTGAVARQALWMAVLFACVMFVLLNSMEPVYHFVGVDARAIPIATGFLEAQSVGVFALLGYFVLRNLCEGLAMTTPAMVISLIGLVLKIPLTYVFVFGAFEFPEMGGVGCGWSNAIIMYFQLLAIIFAVRLTRVRASGLFNRFDWPNFQRIAELIKLGVPIGSTIFVEVAFFSSVTVLIGRLGVEAVAAHQIAMNVGSIGFMIPLAMAMASTIRIGTNVGAQRFHAASRTVQIAIGGAFFVGFVVAVILLTAREPIVGLYTDDLQVISISATLLLLCTVFQLADASQVTAVGLLRGYKDVRVPLLFASFSYWCVGMPVGAILTFGLGPFNGIGVYGFWWGLIAGLSLSCVLQLSRLRWVTIQSRRRLAGPEREVSATSIRQWT